MKQLRERMVLVLGMVVAACGEDEGTGAAEDGVTVTPTGTSQLGTFALDVPASVRRGEDRIFALTLTPAPGETSGVNETLLDSGSVRLAPGRYCALIASQAAQSRMKSKDCGIVIEAGKVTQYRPSTLRTEAEDVAFMQTQQTMFGSLRDLVVRGDHVVEGWFASLRPLTLAVAPGTLTTEMRAEGAAWPAVETAVAPGSDARLGVARGDKVVRVKIGGETGALPVAVEGGGLRWRWEGAPEELREYREWRSTPLAGQIALWAQPAASLVFELGGVERRVSLAEPASSTMYGWRLEITDVTETDDLGRVETIRGLAAVTPKGQPANRLTWTDPAGRTHSSFPTGRSVFVWAGEYDVQVFYVANGVSKTYRESVRVP